MNISANQIGQYASADQPYDQPSYDPPHDSPCPFCSLPITPDDVRTHSILYPGGTRAYFYRTHRSCDENAPDNIRIALDGLAFEAVEAVAP